MCVCVARSVGILFSVSVTLVTDLIIYGNAESKRAGERNKSLDAVLIPTRCNYSVYRCVGDHVRRVIRRWNNALLIDAVFFSFLPLPLLSLPFSLSLFSFFLLSLRAIGFPHTTSHSRSKIEKLMGSYREKLMKANAMERREEIAWRFGCGITIITF